MPKTWEVDAKKWIESVEKDSAIKVKAFAPHNFKDYPELTNNQLALHGALSPHKQHLEDFEGECVKVMDGDTIAVQWQERDFPTKVRFINIEAAELGEGGEDSKAWLTNRVLGKVVEVKLNHKKRTGKYGRLLGRVIHGGMDIGHESAIYGHSEVIA